jgi:hypothetical protein
MLYGERTLEQKDGEKCEISRTRSKQAEFGQFPLQIVGHVLDISAGG